MPVPFLVALLGSALAAAVGVSLVVQYWSQIISWLSDFVIRLKRAFDMASRLIRHGAIVTAAKIKDIYVKIMHKLYYQQNGKWIEETTTRVINESEVPPQILAKVNHTVNEQDITGEMENELQMTI